MNVGWDAQLGKSAVFFAENSVFNTQINPDEGVHLCLAICKQLEIADICYADLDVEHGQRAEVVSVIFAIFLSMNLRYRHCYLFHTLKIISQNPNTREYLEPAHLTKLEAQKWKRKSDKKLAPNHHLLKILLHLYTNSGITFTLATCPKNSEEFKQVQNLFCPEEEGFEITDLSETLRTRPEGNIYIPTPKYAMHQNSPMKPSPGPPPARPYHSDTAPYLFEYPPDEECTTVLIKNGGLNILNWPSMDSWLSSKDISSMSPEDEAKALSRSKILTMLRKKRDDTSIIRHGMAFPNGRGQEKDDEHWKEMAARSKQPVLPKAEDKKSEEEPRKQESGAGNGSKAKEKVEAESFEEKKKRMLADVESDMKNDADRRKKDQVEAAFESNAVLFRQAIREYEGIIGYRDKDDLLEMEARIRKEIRKLYGNIDLSSSKIPLTEDRRATLDFARSCVGEFEKNSISNQREEDMREDKESGENKRNRRFLGVELHEAMEAGRRNEHMDNEIEARVDRLADERLRSLWTSELFGYSDKAQLRDSGDLPIQFQHVIKGVYFRIVTHLKDAYREERTERIARNDEQRRKEDAENNGLTPEEKQLEKERLAQEERELEAKIRAEEAAEAAEKQRVEEETIAKIIKETKEEAAREFERKAAERRKAREEEKARRDAEEKALNMMRAREGKARQEKQRKKREAERAEMEKIIKEKNEKEKAEAERKAMEEKANPVVHSTAKAEDQVESDGEESDSTIQGDEINKSVNIHKATPADAGSALSDKRTTASNKPTATDTSASSCKTIWSQIQIEVLENRLKILRREQRPEDSLVRIICTERGYEDGSPEEDFVKQKVEEKSRPSSKVQ